MSLAREERIADPVGVTLVEFLIATSIMAFVALGVAGMFPAAFRSVVVGGQVTKATVLAQEMMDMIRNDPFDSLVSRYNGFNTNSLSVTCPLADVDKGDTKKKWKCDLLADTVKTGGRGLPAAYGTVAVTSPMADLLRVTVTVFWDRNGARSVNLVTYVARAE